MASEYDHTYFKHDCGYYEYMPGYWLPGKQLPDSMYGTMSRKAVDEAARVPLQDNDVIMAAYPKAGMHK